MSPSRHLDEDDENSDSEDEIICTHPCDIQSTENEESPPVASTTNKSSSSNVNQGLDGKDAAIAVGIAGTAGVAAPVVGTAILTGVGFTSGGVAAGSIAAGLQAGIGNVAAGSLFAACQSVGATGGFALSGPVGIGAAAVGGLGYLGFKAIQNWRRQSSGNEEKSTEKKSENKCTNNNHEIISNVRPMCSDCRAKLLRRITRNYFRH